MRARAIGRRTARAASAVVAAGLVTLVAAACEPPPPVPRPPTPRPPVTTTTTTTPPLAPTELSVTVGVGLRQVATYTVRCGPGPEASITPAVPGLDARRACATVAAERALLVDGPPRGRFCTQQYFGPENARVTGHVGDAPVDQVFRRGNGCAEHDWIRVRELVLRPPFGSWLD